MSRCDETRLSRAPRPGTGGVQGGQGGVPRSPWPLRHRQRTREVWVWGAGASVRLRPCCCAAAGRRSRRPPAPHRARRAREGAARAARNPRVRGDIARARARGAVARQWPGMAKHVFAWPNAAALG